MNCCPNSDDGKHELEYSRTSADWMEIEYRCRLCGQRFLADDLEREDDDE